MSHAPCTFPRLWVAQTPDPGGTIVLPQEQAHYLAHVLRMSVGDRLRLFDGCRGEVLAELARVSKKSVEIRGLEILRSQPPVCPPLHLAFSPLRKERMDFLVEKAVELGVTVLHPVLMERTAVRAVNAGRLHRQIVEAAEQCERLDLPVLTPLRSLGAFLAEFPTDVPVLACLERCEAPTLREAFVGRPCAFLIGPEGGFTEKERDTLVQNVRCRPVSLGPRVLRAETAGLYALAFAAEREKPGAA